MQSADIILEVHQTADGYSIYRPDRAGPALGYFGSYCWWCWRCVGFWGEKHMRKNYRFKWSAVLNAKYLEDKLNKERREDERRSNFVERKVWR